MNTYYNNLTNEQIARWITLLLAVDHIDEYCEENNKSLDNDVLKPIPIKHFIQEKSKGVQINLSIEDCFKYMGESNLEDPNDIKLLSNA